MGVITLNPLSVVHQVWSPLELIRLPQLLSPKSPHKSQPPQERLGVKTIKSMLVVLLLPPGTYPTAAAPQPQIPSQVPTTTGAPGSENNQIYAGSAPPPPWNLSDCRSSSAPNPLTS